MSELTTTSQDYSADIVSTTTGFLMTNAPIATGDNNNVTVQTLQKINVYATEDEANAEGAADKIYVERASAKVSMVVNNSYTVDTPNVPSYDKATVTVTGWTLQRTNKTYYAVRNASNWASWDDADVRFFGERNDPIRVYWAEDPNYPSDEAPADFNVITTASDVDEWNSVEDVNAAYCAENTAPAVNMTKDQLTSSIIRATFQPEGFAAGADFFMMGGTSAIMGIDDFKTWVKDILSAEEVTVSNTVRNPDGGTTVYSRKGTAGDFSFNGDTFSVTTPAAAFIRSSTTSQVEGGTILNSLDDAQTFMVTLGAPTVGQLNTAFNNSFKTQVEGENDGELTINYTYSHNGIELGQSSVKVSVGFDCSALIVNAVTAALNQESVIFY